MTERKPHKWAEVIKAWADGKPIQLRHVSCETWADYISSITPDFNNEFFEWRVKPENIIRDACIRLVGTFDNLNPSLFILETPTVRFEFDPDTYKLVKAEVIG